jgi:OMF family outer membrane factor
MSRKFLVLSALALGLIVPTSAKVYTRDEAVKTAMENSADIKSAEEDLVKASSVVEGGYGAAYPQVDLNADIKWLLGRDDVNVGTRITDLAGDSSMEANKFDKSVLAPAID